MKRCKSCRQLKLVENFHKQRQMASKITNDCEECVFLKRNKRKYLPIEVSGVMYRTMLSNSKLRGHDNPSFSISEFRDWLNNNNFISLLERWEGLGGDKYEKPSIDRLDDEKGYSFENIRLVTWGENEKKGHFDSKFKRIRRTNKTGVRGVCFSKKKGGYRAYITIDNKQVNLGHFDNIDDAKEARVNYEMKLRESF